MKISIIIPCKNEAGTVNHLLESLANQTILPDEVVVVDSNSVDDTVSQALSFKDRLPVKSITASEKGVAHARNAGGQKASGDILFFLDADTELPETFIDDATRLVERDIQVGGFTMRMNSKKFMVRLGARFMNGYVRLMAKTPWPIAFSCIFSTKEAFDKLNGYDPVLFIMEDYDYILRAKRLGYKIGICTTPFSASDRRFVDDPLGSAWKGVYGELYRYTHGLRITKPLFRYDMGGKAKAKPINQK